MPYPITTGGTRRAMRRVRDIDAMLCAGMGVFNNSPSLYMRRMKNNEQSVRRLTSRAVTIDICRYKEKRIEIGDQWIDMQ